MVLKYGTPQALIIEIPTGGQMPYIKTEGDKL
jgi:hypothetical protein